VKRSTLIGVFGCAVLCAVALSAPSAVVAAPRPSAVPITVLVPTGDDASGTAAARKLALQRALATAQATYEDASATVRDAATRYMAATAELPGAEQDLATANGHVIAAKVTLDQADTALDSADAAVSLANAALTTANGKVSAERDLMAGVATAVYQGSPLLQVNSLLTDGSPGEVLDRFGYANQVMASQQAVLNSYLASRMNAKYAVNRAQAAAKTATAARTQAATALSAARKTKAAALAAQDKVDALIAARKSALAVAEQNKAAVLQQYNALAKQNKQVETQLATQAANDDKAAKAAATKAAAARRTAAQKAAAAKAAAKAAKQVVSGYDTMPVHGWKSSNFGMRYDPIYKRWQLHAGVDIAAAGGTPIRAARAGKVVRAGWDGGYGNYTCVDTGIFHGAGRYHNKDIVNCYAHQSRIMVHVGERVAHGQTIGLVGETGAATGFHLHFEVRVNGNPVDPNAYL